MPYLKSYKFIFCILALLVIIYFTQLVQATASNKKTIQGDLTVTSTTNDFNGSDNLYEIRGNLTFNADLNNSTNNRVLIIFVNNNLTINNRLIHPDANSGLVFVVKGNVNIHKNVTQIDAVIISEGTIYTGIDSGESCSHTSPVTANQLVINGSLISLHPDKNIEFCRILPENQNTTLAAEKINHQIKYLPILRDLLSDTYQKWSEVQ